MKCGCNKNQYRINYSLSITMLMHFNICFPYFQGFKALHHILACCSFRQYDHIMQLAKSIIVKTLIKGDLLDLLPVSDNVVAEYLFPNLDLSNSNSSDF